MIPIVLNYYGRQLAVWALTLTVCRLKTASLKELTISGSTSWGLVTNWFELNKLHLERFLYHHYEVPDRQSAKNN